MTVVEMTKMLLPVIILEVALKVYCLVVLFKKDTAVKYMPKWAWALVIIFIGLFGSIAFLIFGRERG